MRTSKYYIKLLQKFIVLMLQDKTIKYISRGTETKRISVQYPLQLLPEHKHALLKLRANIGK